MAFLHSDVYDSGLAELADGTALHIISGASDPADRAAVISASLGNKATPTIGAPGAGSPNGRQVTISAITDGSTTTSGTATRWALIDGTRLLACNTLASSVAVTSGVNWTLASFTIRIPAVS